uniref:Thioredoxin n=1 Tax=Candidatus Methanogaster sp. ANME-2c ERB4 TaxID=2759911 RepID=A0A7G9Y2X4_9EURY|nr:hypothetical protein FFGIDPFI_00003 [Methanosarcinales archaeon ANME-2c ERB4]
MKRYLPLFTTIVFIALLVLGIWSGEVPVVWHKAITVCLSCIGIG